jgi:type II secretory pathway pseudopilin PulG
MAGMTLVEILMTLVIFSIVIISLLAIFTNISGESLKLVKRVEDYGNIFTAEEILQYEIAQAGPEVRYITLIKNNDDEKYRGLRYTVFIPFTGTRITKQIYFKNNKIKVWEKNFNKTDFPEDVESKKLTVNNLEPNGVNIILSTSEFSDLDVSFYRIGNRKVNYTIKSTKLNKEKIYNSSVFLINLK